MNWAELIVDIEPAGTVTLLDFLKDLKGIDDVAQDTELTTALNIAGGICESYVDSVIAKRPCEEYFQSYFGRVTLHNIPIDTTEPLTVSLDGVEQTGYSIFQGRWQLPHLTRQSHQMDTPLDWRTYQQAVVGYTAGYDPIPVDLAQAIIYVASDLSTAAGTGAPAGGASGEVKSMSIHDVGSISYDVGSSSGGGSISSFGVINEAAAHLMSKYKRMAA